MAQSVEVHVFVRRQDKYIESSYCQYVTAGLWIGNIQPQSDSFIANLASSMDHHANFELWRSLSGADHFFPVPYVNADTSDIFFRSIGAQEALVQVEGRRNAREPVDFLRASVFAGETIADRLGFGHHKFADLNKRFGFRANIRQKLTQAFAESGVLDPKYAFLPEATLRRLDDTYRAANDAVLDAYGMEQSAGFSTFEFDEKLYVDLGIQSVNPEHFALIFKALTEQLYELDLRLIARASENVQ